jgi:fumarate hydratase, class I
MSKYQYEAIFQLDSDQTVYRKLTGDHVRTRTFDDRQVLQVNPEALQLLAREALKDVSFLLRTNHLQQVAAILDDPEASDNDRFVAHTLLKNAAIAAQGELPSCQDTGTVIVMAKKGQQVWTDGNDAEAISQGIYQTYQESNLRYSQIAPLGMFEEKNTGNNLPAQIDIYSTDGAEYHFLFLAKGGGSANKTFLYQETKALLTDERLDEFLNSKLRSIGTAACPPYHLAVVVGGTSAEMTLKTVKLATTGSLDSLPTEGSASGRAYRDLEWEARVQRMAQESQIGAQFGGKHFAHDVRVIRLPRHAASCPVGIGVSCSADRNIKAKITHEGLFLEQLEADPARFLPAAEVKMQPPVEVDLNRPMAEILQQLSRYPVKTRLNLHGTLIVARDIAHARIGQMLDRGEPMPDYFQNHPVYYAGPAKTPTGKPSGSFGPTTAGRMDSYVEPFQAAGGSMIMLAKGNRSREVAAACARHGGFYLGSIGGPAAILAEENIKSVAVVDFPELGMEAVRRIEVENFPAFIIVDNKGNDFYADLLEKG